MTPAFKVLANGADITAAIQRRLVSLSVADVVGTRADDLDLVVEDADEHMALPSRGAQLEVWLGYVGALRKVGLFTVDALKMSGPPSQISIKGSGCSWIKADRYAAIHTQKSRSWEPATLGDLAKKIAAEHGLTASVSPTAAVVELPHLDQTDEGDLNFLMRVASERDMLVKGVEGRLVVLSMEEGVSSTGKKLPTFYIHRSEVSRFEIDLSAKKTFSRVVAQWRDTGAAITHEVEAGVGEPTWRANGTYTDESTAKHAADALLSQFRRAGSSFSITMSGRAELMAEGRIVLQGFRSEIREAQWKIVKIEHRLSRAGFVSNISGIAASEILPPPVSVD